LLGGGCDLLFGRGRVSLIDGRFQDGLQPAPGHCAK
jgi:hypothetical protein